MLNEYGGRSRTTMVEEGVKHLALTVYEHYSGCDE